MIIPGEPELEAEKHRKQMGVPLVESVVLDLEGLAEKLKLDFNPY